LIEHQNIITISLANNVACKTQQSNFIINTNVKILPKLCILKLFQNAGKDDSPAMTMHGKLKDPKKFQTPAPNKYEAILPEEQPSFAFGVKHSPYLYSGKQVTGDRWVSTKTEMGQKREEEFRPRSGTFTRDKPTVLRSTSAIRQSQAVA